MSVELGLADQKKAIELLYSQYSRPIQTCVQELVSNAFDAMQDAERSHVPIKITLPNELNDFYFSVRDFGNSMDEDTIKNVYMRVNASTKSSDNKAIGGFGIGSKTPWAYTDTFILKTFLNGLETQYALVKGRSSVSIVYKGKTEQENGTEVIFKTKERDKDYFEQAVQRISLCAKTKPIVNTKKPLSFDREDILSPSVKVVSSNLLDEGVYFNIGGVLYDANIGLLDNSKTPWRCTTSVQTLDGYLSSSALIISVPVGAIMPLQTREGLFTNGEEGQHNKSMAKKLFNHALKVVESTIDARKKMVTSPKQAVEFFANGMLDLKERFTFGNLEISASGFTFKGINAITDLSRKKSRGWGKTVKAKKINLSYLQFRDINKCPVFYSELSPNKARLVNRLNRLCATNDVIVLEQHLFKDIDVYSFLKEFTGAQNVEEVEVEKLTSSNKGKKKDVSKIVYYNSYGDRRGTIDLDNLNDKKYVMREKDTGGFKLGSRFYEYLGYKTICVAPTNYKKLLDHENFFTEEEANDFTLIKEKYIKYRFRNALNDCRQLRRNNFSYVKNLANPNKQTLFKQDEYVDSRLFNYALVDALEEKYGSAIDRTIKKMLKQRVRANALVDKAPLVRHVNSPESLKGQAKKDLDAYIVNNIGVWYGTHQLKGQ